MDLAPYIAPFSHVCDHPLVFDLLHKHNNAPLPDVIKNVRLNLHLFSYAFISFFL